ncbi:MAG: exo-alpha-sialidase [Ruminococcaceae bacterium]|nr:exo-alpha-sialidase [Oscillospiraceae bacterium]
MKEIFPEVKHGIVHRVPNTVFRYNGWPTVCKDDRGVLYCTASGMRIQHVDPSGKNCMWLSFNEGETWTPPMIVNDSYMDDRDAGITYIGDGKLIMSWFSNYGKDHYKWYEDTDYLHPADKEMILALGRVLDTLPKEDLKDGNYVKLSKDYGVTWSDPVETPMSCPHGPNVMNDGTLIYLGKIQFDNGTQNYKAIAAYHSDDDGMTWTLRGTVPVPDDLVPDHFHEPHVIQLPNGRLLGAIRCHERPVQPSFTVYTTFSDDGGYTWSMPKCLGVDGSPPHLLLHSSGAVICSYSRRGGPTNSSERACVSYDGGETWTEDYVIHPKVPFCDHGYPATVELKDGSLLTVYYQAWDNDNFCSILQTKWSLGDK